MYYSISFYNNTQTSCWVTVISSITDVLVIHSEWSNDGAYQRNVSLLSECYVHKAILRKFFHSSDGQKL